MSGREYSAGVYDQCQALGVCSCSGWHRVEWSRHSRPELARAAARRYQRQLPRRGQRTPVGGAKSWSAWWAGPDGVVEEMR